MCFAIANTPYKNGDRWGGAIAFFRYGREMRSGGAWHYVIAR
ncbi:hypothetical protein [Pleurocapsa sp. PCC 7319]|nr:hypothetical protein [Pleurocapsa sp. PCC 7319]